MHKGTCIATHHRCYTCYKLFYVRKQHKESTECTLGTYFGVNIKLPICKKDILNLKKINIGCSRFRVFSNARCFNVSMYYSRVLRLRRNTHWHEDASFDSLLSCAGSGHLWKGWIVRGTTIRRFPYWANGLFYPTLLRQNDLSVWRTIIYFSIQNHRPRSIKRYGKNRLDYSRVRLIPGNRRPHCRRCGTRSSESTRKGSFETNSFEFWSFQQTPLFWSSIRFGNIRVL